MADSETLFQSLSQKSTLVQVVTFVGVSGTSNIRFRVPNTFCSLLFRRFVFSKGGKILCGAYRPLNQKSIESNFERNLIRIGEFLPVHKFKKLSWQMF